MTPLFIIRIKNLKRALKQVDKLLSIDCRFQSTSLMAVNQVNRSDCSIFQANRLQYKYKR